MHRSCSADQRWRKPRLRSICTTAEQRTTLFLLTATLLFRLAYSRPRSVRPSQGGLMNDELQHLKNLGKTSAQWLHAVGIHSASELRRRGAVDAYRAVQIRGFRASKVLLYSIEGALMDIHWNELSSEHKTLLLQQLDGTDVTDRDNAPLGMSRKIL